MEWWQKNTLDSCLWTICGQSEPWDSNSVKIWNLFCVNNPLPTALSIPFVLKQADSFEEPNRPSAVFGDKSCSWANTQMKTQPLPFNSGSITAKHNHQCLHYLLSKWSCSVTVIRQSLRRRPELPLTILGRREGVTSASLAVSPPTTGVKIFHH